VGVATETGDESEVQVKDILQPLNGSGGLVCEDLDQVGAGLVTGGLEGVIVELLDAVLDTEVGLSTSKGTVDTRGGLGGVTTEKGLLVENEDVAAVQVDGVGGTKTGD
jgi:hypothetical protein